MTIFDMGKNSRTWDHDLAANTNLSAMNASDPLITMISLKEWMDDMLEKNEKRMQERDAMLMGYGGFALDRGQGEEWVLPRPVVNQIRKKAPTLVTKKVGTLLGINIYAVDELSVPQLEAAIEKKTTVKLHPKKEGDRDDPRKQL
jgi:hypothetical protein